MRKMLDEDQEMREFADLLDKQPSGTFLSLPFDNSNTVSVSPSLYVKVGNGVAQWEAFVPAGGRYYASEVSRAFYMFPWSLS